MMIYNSIIPLFLILMMILMSSTIGSSSSSSSSSSIKNLKPFPVIVDTDIGLYPDDVGAMAILHSYADQNLIQIKAIMANDGYEGIIPVLEVLNNYFNRSSIQLGITKDSNAYSTNQKNLTWSKWMIEQHPELHRMYQKNSEAENSISLYRRMLANADDNSMIILSIGYLTNLANLLDSDSDQYSNLDGVDLIQLKCKKLILMAGQFPNGTEWNIQQQIRSARKTMKKWPTEMIFVGYEIGSEIQCGQGLLSNNTELENSPVRKAFIIAEQESILKDGCFDEIAAFLLGNDEFLQSYYELIYGKIEIESNGFNKWIESKGNKPTKMAYLKTISNNKKEDNYKENLLKLMNPLIER